MKKLVFALGAVAMLSMVSCGKKEAKTESVVEAVADSTAQEAPQPAAEGEKAVEGVAALSEIPKFSNEEIQKIAGEFAAFQKEFIEAAKAKDDAKITELTQKAQELDKSTKEKLDKMSDEDKKLWTEWAQKIATEVVAAAQAQ